MRTPGTRAIAAISAGILALVGFGVCRADDDAGFKRVPAHPRLDQDSQSSYDGFHPFSDFGRETGDGKRPPARDFSLPRSAPESRSAGQDEVKDDISHPYSGPQTATILPGPDEFVLPKDKRRAFDLDRDAPSTPQERMNVLNMTREDAAENFPNVIQAHLSRHGVHGHWLDHDKRRPREMAFLSIDPKSMTNSSPHRYTGCATFEDVAGGGRVLAEVTVDFGEPAWKVVSIKPRTPTGPCAED